MATEQINNISWIIKRDHDDVVDLEKTQSVKHNDAIMFAKWVTINYWRYVNGAWSNDKQEYKNNRDIYITSEELYELWQQNR